MTKNELILFCLPNHIAQYIQSLVNSFSKQLKTYCVQVLNACILSWSYGKLSRLQFSSCLHTDWIKAVAVENDTSGFSVVGIYPYNPQVIPEHTFAMSDFSNYVRAVVSTSVAYDNRPTSAAASN